MNMKMMKFVNKIDPVFKKFLSKIDPVFKKFLSKLLFLKTIPFYKLLILVVGCASVGVFLAFNLLTSIPEKPEWKNYLQKADRLYQEGKLKEAKKMYLEFKRMFPSNPRINWVNFQLANILKNSGFIHRATFFYEKAATPDFSYYFEAKYNLAQCYQEAGEPDKALKIATKIIREFPENEKLSGVYLILANSLLEQSKKKEAISIYQKIIKEYPSEHTAGEAYLKMGDIYFEEKRYSEAILFYSSLIKEYPENQLQEKAFFNLARCYLAQNEQDKALSMLFLLSEKFPHSDLFIKGLFLAGKVFLEKEEYEKAREIFERISKIYPEQSPAAVEVKKKLAEVYLAEGNLSRAIAIYEKIIQKYPYHQDGEKIYFTLASVYLTTGEYDKAIQVFQKFIHYFPLSFKLSSAYLNLARAYFNKKLYFKAIEAFNQVMQHSSSREEIDIALSGIAEIYMKVGLWNEAIECLKQKLSLADQEKKETLPIKIKLINCYLKKKDLSSAKELLLPLIKNFPKEKALEFLEIGDLLYSAGEKEIACSIYQKVAKFILPEDKRGLYILFKMADFQKDEGRINSAINIYHRILKLTEKNSLKKLPVREKTLSRLADFYYSTQKYQKACGLYLKVLEEYPESKDLDWYLYQTGNCYRHLESYGKAKKFYLTLKEKFPQSLWTKISEVML